MRSPNFKGGWGSFGGRADVIGSLSGCGDAQLDRRIPHLLVPQGPRCWRAGVLDAQSWEGQESLALARADVRQVEVVRALGSTGSHLGHDQMCRCGSPRRRALEVGAPPAVQRYEVLPPPAGHLGAVAVALRTVPVVYEHRHAVRRADQDHQPPRLAVCADHDVEAGVVLAELRFELVAPGPEQRFEGSSKAGPVWSDRRGRGGGAAGIGCHCHKKGRSPVVASACRKRSASDLSRVVVRRTDSCRPPSVAPGESRITVCDDVRQRTVGPVALPPYDVGEPRR